jgi:predicted Rossmann-fold nucleotide-binding protein
MIEIIDADACREWLADPLRPPAALRGLDLRDRPEFERGSFDDSLFLSCRLTPRQAAHLTATGATVLIDDASRPYAAHRATLYTPAELFAGFDPDGPPDSAGYAATLDAEVFRHVAATGGAQPTSIAESLAQRLHDHAITESLDAALAGTRPVAIMGGHDLERASAQYAMVATLARRLAREGYLLLSGGGPGAMEATHLGAWMAAYPDDELAAALAVLAPRPAGNSPGGEYRDADWLHRAWQVRERWPEGVDNPSIGIPTWVYGHEPPAAFAGQLAKYFANSVREEGLLAVATHGVVFTPGSAGTVQEIFQDATQNHYASFGPASPMVLLGVAHWTEHLPVWPLLQALSAHRAYGDLIVLTDDPDEASRVIRAYARVAPA